MLPLALRGPLLATACGLLLTVSCLRPSAGAPLPAFDFTGPAAVGEWQPTHDIGSIEPTPEGMAIRITGGDPYTVGPPRDYPADQTLWMRIRLKSDEGGTGQVFFFQAGGPVEDRSVHFPARAGQWDDVKVPLPALGPGTRLRLDPPGMSGTCVVASISFEPRVLLKEPAWPKPEPPDLTGGLLTVRSGPLEIAQNRSRLGGFEVRVDGRPMAAGLTRPLVGYAREDGLRWVDVAGAARVSASRENDSVVVTAAFQDPDGATWKLTQRFTPMEGRSAIAVSARAEVDRDRTVVFLPLVALLPGLGSFGENKGHAVFAGLEYLDGSEPSSSEADIEGPGARRQVPDTEKITFPLMALQNDGRYVGLIWEPGPNFAAVFDSPDRLFHSGGHVMGVLFPGSDGSNRVEGDLLPYDGVRLAAGQAVALSAIVIGGAGQSVVPAVQQYVALRGLPPVPAVGMDYPGYVSLASGGWLDSKIRVGDEYRHAYWPGSSFGPGPAADAALLQDWLASEAAEAGLASRLRASARAAIARVPPADYNTSGVSHVRYPLGSLVYGGVAESAERAAEAGRALLQRFEPDGSVLYKPQPGGPDYGRTHFAKDANGLTGQVVSSLLEDAVVSGDPTLVREGLRVLRALDKFANSAPRGAQTWEVPLHTPDILGSAHLVRAYTLGYELTGERRYLDQARYWAWTGLPFTYLVNPTGQPTGPYATIAVFGATGWKAPNWMGMPVQWCGLVYSDALYRLLPDDPGGPWKQIADGIAASGIQQSWPTADTDLQGLLPDSFNIRPQTRNPVAINPGTVQTNAVRLFNRPALYVFRVFRQAGAMVHAPGAITDARDGAGRISFKAECWPDHPCYLLVTGLRAAPRVKVDGKEVAPGGANQYVEGAGRLILQVQGSVSVELALR